MADRSLSLVLASGLSTKAATTGSVPVRSSLWGWIREANSGDWQNGVSVDPIGSITSFGAVFACIARIASDIAKLELKLMSKDADGIDEQAIAASPYWPVLRKPNHYQNRIQFLTYWLVSKLLYGNTYAIKKRDVRGIVTGLYILDPRRVTPMVTPSGDVYYSLGGDDLSRIPTGMVLPASEVIHDRGLTLWHPLVGISPLHAAAMSATQGNRIQTNSATFFQNMSRPSGMLTAPETIPDETALRLKTEFEKNFAGANIGRLLVAGDGLEYKPMTIPAQTAQLLEQLNWTVEDVARPFFMPLYKINSGPMPTAGNVEALESQYYTGCLQSYIESIELCLTEGLEMQSLGYHVEMDLDGLLRMDSATQITMLSEAVKGALMKPDEARARLNLKPVVGGGAVYLQQQNFSLEALAKRDAGTDPFGAAKPPTPAPMPAADPAAAAAPAKSIEDVTSAAITLIEQSMGEAAKEASDTADAAKQSLQTFMADMAASIPALVQRAVQDSLPAPVELKAVEGEQESDAEDLAAALIAKFTAATHEC